MYTRKCPKCDGEMLYSSKDSLRCGAKRQSTCCSSHARQKHFVGKPLSEETRQRISESNKGKEYNRSLLGTHQTPEHIQKRRISCKGRKPGFGNKTHSADTRLLQREARLADIDSKYPLGWTSPNYNKAACILFEQINEEMGWNGQHAERGGEVRILGFFLDFYEPTQNVVIEYDEPRHKIPSQKAKDDHKQAEVTKLLGCRFYRIKQGQDSMWKQIIT